MNWSDWIGFAGSIFGGIIGGLFTYLGVKMTLNHEDRKRKQDEIKKAYDERPRFEIDSFSEIDKCNNKLCDTNLVLLHFETKLYNNGKALFIYDDKLNNKDNFISFEYVLKNAGKTEIDNITFVSNLQKDTSLMDMNNIKFYDDNQMINYDVVLKKRFIKQDENIKILISFIDEQVILSNLGSSTIGIYIEDINGRYWYQSLNCPKNEVGNSIPTNLKSLKNAIDVNLSIKCFEGKDCW